MFVDHTGDQWSPLRQDCGAFAVQPVGRGGVKQTCREHVFSSDRSGYAARRELRRSRRLMPPLLTTPAGVFRGQPTQSGGSWAEMGRWQVEAVTERFLPPCLRLAALACMRSTDQKSIAKGSNFWGVTEKGGCRRMPTGGIHFAVKATYFCHGTKVGKNPQGGCGPLDPIGAFMCRFALRQPALTGRRGPAALRSHSAA